MRLLLPVCLILPLLRTCTAPQLVHRCYHSHLPYFLALHWPPTPPHACRCLACLPPPLQVREALAHKVSRERVGAELEGMIHGEWPESEAGRRCGCTAAGSSSAWGGVGPRSSQLPRTSACLPRTSACLGTHAAAGPDPVMALRLLHRLRIFAAVFALPPAAAGVLGEAAFGATAASLGAGAFDAMQAWPRPESGFDQDARRRCLLAALLLPVAGVQVPAAKGKQTR